MPFGAFLLVAALSLALSSCGDGDTAYPVASDSVPHSLDGFSMTTQTVADGSLCVELDGPPEVLFEPPVRACSTARELDEAVVRILAVSAVDGSQVARVGLVAPDVTRLTFTSSDGSTVETQMNGQGFYSVLPVGEQLASASIVIGDQTFSCMAVPGTAPDELFACR